MKTLLLVLGFAIVVFLVYKFWKPFLRPPQQKVPENEATLYFFYTDWCGFSQKALPEWEKVERLLQNSSYYGTTHVTPVKVNCETDKSKCGMYGVNAYPTLVIETKDGIHDFNQRPTLSSLRTFLRETLGQERESL